MATRTIRTAATRQGKNRKKENLLSEAPSVDLLISVDVKKHLVAAKNHYFKNGLGVQRLASYDRIKSSKYFGNFPQGVAPSVRKDLSLLDASEDFGIMVRRPTLHILNQMREFQKLRNEPMREPSIPYSGFFLDGPRGCGKSYVLQHVVWWARRHGWIVIFENEPENYLKKAAAIVRSTGGIYMQGLFTKRFLDTLWESSKHQLQQIPVCLDSYGNSSLDGNKLSFSQRLLSPLLDQAVSTRMARDLGISPKTAADGYNREPSLEERLLCNGRDSIELLKRRLFLKHQFNSLLKVSPLKSALPSPKTVSEIVEIGRKSRHLATVAAYETVEQLKQQTMFPVLFAVDNWNTLFEVSRYVSVRYDLTKYNGYIPGPHLAMPRLLSRWDGANFKRGIKIVATSWFRQRRRQFDPSLLGVKPDEIVQVPAFNGAEFQRFVEYYASKQGVLQFPNSKVDYFQMVSGGNGELARKALATFY